MTVLANEPLGSFMVRKSETQPGRVGHGAISLTQYQNLKGVPFQATFFWDNLLIVVSLLKTWTGNHLHIITSLSCFHTIQQIKRYCN